MIAIHKIKHLKKKIRFIIPFSKIAVLVIFAFTSCEEEKLYNPSYMCISVSVQSADSTVYISLHLPNESIEFFKIPLGVTDTTISRFMPPGMSNYYLSGVIYSSDTTVSYAEVDYSGHATNNVLHYVFPRDTCCLAN